VWRASRCIPPRWRRWRNRLMRRCRQGVLDLPIGQLVLQAINGKAGGEHVQEAQTGRLVRAAAPVAASGRGNEVGGWWWWTPMCPESLLANDGRHWPPIRRIQANQGDEKSNQGRRLFVRRRHHDVDSVRGDLVRISTSHAASRFRSSDWPKRRMRLRKAIYPYASTRKPPTRLERSSIRSTG
jgi:hypothetical protein